MRARRARLVAAALAVVAVLGSARPAAADPARPGNVRSAVVAVEPPGPLSARVIGGDAFLELTVAPGHEAVVLDYTGGDYLRFAPDGAVLENRSSPAWILNRTRYATGDPGEVDPGAAADWHRVAGAGEYAWHDHRVHWMSPTPAPDTAWTVALRVDGRPVAITGRYGPVDAPPAWPWWLAVVGAATIAALATARRVTAGAGVALVAAALAGPVARELAELPGSTWTQTALVVAAAGAAIGALARRGPTGAALLAGAGVALALWGVRRTTVFDHAVLVTPLPAAVDRLAVAVALGAGVGVTLAAARRIAATPIERRPAADGGTA
jgi:hypothetical protein